MSRLSKFNSLFFFNDTATTEIYTLSLHDALPIWPLRNLRPMRCPAKRDDPFINSSLRGWLPRMERSSCLRSEEHTSELQSPDHLVCRLLLEKKNKTTHRLATAQYYACL